MRLTTALILAVALLSVAMPMSIRAAVVDVKNFGAVPNDGANDFLAIQAAINASKFGDTILFDGGEFDLPGTSGDALKILGDRTYRGNNGATLKGRGANGQLLSIKADNVKISGLTFDGGGLFFDRDAGLMNAGINIDGNTFKLNTSGKNPSAITFTSGLKNSWITNNYFTGYTGGFGIYGYNYQTLTIANNEFVNVNAGMHIDAFTDSGNLVVEQNYMTGLKGMGLEFQSTAVGLVFQDNWYEHPNLSTNFAANNNAFAYSLILDKSRDIVIRRNTVIAPERPDRVGTRIGFEVGGDNTIVEDNYIDGVNHTVAMNDGVGTASVTVRNNKFKNFLQGVSNSFPTATRTLTQLNNGANVILSVTMEARIAAMAKPGIGAKRYDPTKPQSIPSTKPAPTPTTRPATQPTGEFVEMVADLSAATNGWGPPEVDQSVGEAGRDDGGPISLGGGYVYRKGFGLHAPAVLPTIAPARAVRFIADIGIDDETKGKGSSTVIIHIAGKPVTAELVRGGGPIWTVSVPVQPGDPLDINPTVEGSPDFAHVSVGNGRFILGPVVTPDQLAQLQAENAGLKAQNASLQGELTRETARGNALDQVLNLWKAWGALRPGN